MFKYVNDTDLHDRYDMGEILDALKYAPSRTMQGRGSREKVEYIELACSFDIETSSWYEIDGKQVSNEEIAQKEEAEKLLLSDCKRAAMYCWQMSVHGHVIMGRTWEALEELIEELVDTFKLNLKRRLIVYVHNLSYEFGFMAKRFKWYEVFSIDTREPIKAVTMNGIEFRCSAILSGKKLEELETIKYPIKKLVGSLGYNKIRNSQTPLTEEEKAYCINDALVVSSYIAEQIELDGLINIPLTNTGYIRDLCKKATIQSKDDKTKKSYKQLMKSLILKDDEYDELRKAFMGGFTHANALYVRDTLEDVASYDKSSDYAFVLTAYKYPMGWGRYLGSMSAQTFDVKAKQDALLGTFTFKNIRLKETSCEAPISLSKCQDIEGEVLDNGRIESAAMLKTIMTELDWQTVREFYDFEEVRIESVTAFSKLYLPKELIEVILNLYGKKTSLKNTPEKAEYNRAKRRLSSIYGMMATAPVRNSFKYDGEWTEEENCSGIDGYNTSSSRFIYYPWAVWCTAYARRLLFKAIRALGEDYVYSDTDSVKFLNWEKHKGYFEKDNAESRHLLEEALKWHKLPVEKIAPKDITGKERMLGAWEFEGIYDRFKTLGAKRYISQRDDKLEITVSGLNGDKAAEYFAGRDIFDEFDDEMEVPAGHTGRLTVFYIDRHTEGKVTDYLGNTAPYMEETSIHMEESGFKIGMDDDFLTFLACLKYGRRELK